MANQLDYGLHTRSLNAIELRRYAMKHGRRDDLISLFEREFVESQEACGMLPIGHFRDPADADAFVWFRGFESMDVRAAQLGAFYTSDIWLRNRDAANATLIDSDNVLLLREARPGSGFDLLGLWRPPLGEHPPRNARTIAVSIAMADDAVRDADIETFEETTLGVARKAASGVAYFVSEERPNDYPRLPVRPEHALVATGICASAREIDGWKSAFCAPQWETLMLVPAARSLLR